MENTFLLEMDAVVVERKSLCLKKHNGWGVNHTGSLIKNAGHRVGNSFHISNPRQVCEGSLEFAPESVQSPEPISYLSPMSLNSEWCTGKRWISRKKLKMGMRMRSLWMCLQHGVARRVE